MADGVHVALGGVWKKHHEDKSKLEHQVKALEADLRASRQAEDVARAKQAGVQEALETTRTQLFALRLEHEKLLQSLHTEKRTRQSGSNEIHRLQEALETQLSTSERLQQDLAGSREEVRTVRRDIRAAEQTISDLTSEVSELQYQYDKMEQRANDFDAAWQTECTKTAVLEKAKRQKEDHVVLLLKEKDRLYRQLAHTRSLLKKSVSNSLSAKELSAADTWSPPPARSTPGRSTPGRGTPSSATKSLPGSQRRSRSLRRRTPLSAVGPPGSGTPGRRSAIDVLATPKSPPRSTAATNGADGGPSPWPSTLRQSDADDELLRLAAAAAEDGGGGGGGGGDDDDNHSDEEPRRLMFEPASALSTPPRRRAVAPPAVPTTPSSVGGGSARSRRRRQRLTPDESHLLTRRVTNLQHKVETLAERNSGLEAEVRRLREKGRQHQSRYRTAVSSSERRKR